MKRKRKIYIQNTLNECIDETGLSNQEGRVIVDKYLLSGTDRITYIRLINSENKVSIVINVSYEILFKNKWITIIRFDSFHGLLHRHSRISLEDPNTIVESYGVIKKGKPNNWLTWATSHLNKKFYEYKIGFCRRSKVKVIDI